MLVASLFYLLILGYDATASSKSITLLTASESLTVRAARADNCTPIQVSCQSLHLVAFGSWESIRCLYNMLGSCSVQLRVLEVRFVLEFLMLRNENRKPDFAIILERQNTYRDSLFTLNELVLTRLTVCTAI